MKQFYKDCRFQRETLKLIDTMNDVVTDYVRQGFVLTVRQLYYQLVSRNVIPNTEKSYKRVTGVVNDAKLAGLMDWDAIEDRTRAFIRNSAWDNGADILRSAAHGFHMDMWETQPNRAYVIIEKEALAGVMEGVCREYDIPLLAARGYPSGTVLREFAKRDILSAFRQGQDVTILHFGDHDPSGIDMTRDLTERLDLFGEQKGVIDLRRIALNRDQIDQYNPPPNPAKATDARFEAYMREHGTESWELDALEPNVLIQLVKDHVEPIIDQDAWDTRKQDIDEVKSRILRVAEDFDE